MKKPKTLKPGGFVFRLLSATVMAMMLAWKTLRLPGALLPFKKLRLVNRYWTSEMLVNYVITLGTKLPQDQLCVPRIPEKFEPLVDVVEANRLSSDEIKTFYEKGHLEPFTVFSEEEMEVLEGKLLKRREEVNSIYGFVADRDRHLEMPELTRIIANPAITDRLAQLLGPNLICWRSQIFHKPPGAGPVGWHQASTYMFEEAFTEPLLFPPDTGELFMLTVWIPANLTTRENGCLKFIRGSLAQGIRWMRLGGDIGFHAVNYYPDYEVDENTVEYVEMKRGQVLIFSERTVHGSDPNQTNGNRLAFNFRVAPTHVEVYPGNKKFHLSSQMGERYDMAKWNAIVVRGEDTTGINKTVPWRQYA